MARRRLTGRLSAAALLGLAASVPRAAPAQAATDSVLARITGSVFDSVAMRPLAGARVQLVDTREPARVRTVLSDSLGRFVHDGVVRGVWLLGFVHPRADTLALVPPVLQVAVRAPGTVRAELALPSSRTLVARVCRSDFRTDSLGLLVGTVRDARDGRARAGVTVRAQWRELSLRASGLFLTTEATEATSQEDGRFAMCGLPAGVPVMFVAGLDADSTGSFDHVPPAHGYEVRDLFIGRAERERMVVRDPAAPPGQPADVAIDVVRGEGRVRGRAVRTDGTPIAGAIVRAWRGGAEATTGSDGWFRLDSIPAGTQTIEVRALGFLPERRAVDVLATDVAASGFTLDQLAAITLDTMRVVASATTSVYRSPALLRFEERRKRAAAGHFIGEEELERRDPLYVSDMLRRIPGVLVLPNLRGSGYSITMSGGEAMSTTGRCSPGIWLDGAEVFGGFPLDQFISGKEIRAMEVYTRAVQVPAEFQRMNGCGVIVIWTGERQAKAPARR